VKVDRVPPDPPTPDYRILLDPEEAETLRIILAAYCDSDVRPLHRYNFAKKLIAGLGNA
jgi:hypothetical protein